jgi:hypothetical protein
MSSRNSAPLGSAVLPVYNALGGPQGKGHVTFDRAQSQYLDAGPRTLNIATNGGLTIVAVVRFTGSIGQNERLIEIPTVGATENFETIFLSRIDFSTDLIFRVYQTPSLQLIVDKTCPAVLLQNTWLTVVVSYRGSTREYSVNVNNANCAGIASEFVSDRTVAKTYVGRTWWRPDINDWVAYLNGDIAGVFVVDEYLSTDATSAIADAMARGEDLTTQGPCAPQVISPLLPVVLSSADLCNPVSLSGARFVSLLPLK